MTLSVHRQSSLLIALCLAGLAGCGTSDRKTVYPARGKLLDAEGKPAAGAVVTLHPTASPDDYRHKPAGMADKEGNFVLGTYGESDGAPAGDYIVTVEWRPIRKNAFDPDQPDRLKGKFRDPKSSPFRATIEKKATELPPIRLP